MSHPLSDTFSHDLLAWFAHAAADFPWRQNRDPYRVWLSEIMLQQTQVTTVIGYFERFIAAYPTVQALAAAPLDDVLKHWEGLGYYARARNLHKTAIRVVNDYGGRFPETSLALAELPGIGRYTANAIASIAFGERVAVLDGNVIRVLARLYDFPQDVASAAAQRQLWAYAEALIAGVERPGDYNQAMMELGREVCRPQNPHCAKCPVETVCRARRAGTQRERPVKTARLAAPHYDVGAAVLRDSAGRLLIAQRPADGLLGGLWEFPSGRCEPGEPPQSALARALKDKLSLQVDIGDLLLVVKHAFTHFRITLHAFACENPRGELALFDYTAALWVSESDLGAYAFPRADRRVIEHLAGRTSRLF